MLKVRDWLKAQRDGAQFHPVIRVNKNIHGVIRLKDDRAFQLTDEYEYTHADVRYKFIHFFENLKTVSLAVIYKTSFTAIVCDINDLEMRLESYKFGIQEK
jgi:hypothetical protein